MYLSNLSSLYNDMKNKHWTIVSFHFKYIDHYNVLIKRSSRKLSKLGYHLNFEFIDKDNYFKKHLLVAVNPYTGYTADIYGHNANKIGIILKKYFNVNGKVGKFTINRFYKYLNKFIPMSVPNSYPKDLKMDMVHSLGKSDPSDDPDKIYLYKIRHNNSPRTRTAFNDDKTKLLYPKTYKQVLSNVANNGKDISFVYSTKSKYKNAWKNI